LFYGRGRGARGRAATEGFLGSTQSAEPILPYNGTDESGRDLFILFPVFGTVAEWQKPSQSSVKGWRFATANTTRLLTGWIGYVWIKYLFLLRVEE